MSPQLALVGLSIAPPVAGISIVYGRYVRGLSKSVQDSLAQATQVAEERISNIRTVRAFGQEEKEFLRYNDRIDHAMMLGYKESMARGIFMGVVI